MNIKLCEIDDDDEKCPHLAVDEFGWCADCDKDVWADLVDIAYKRVEIEEGH